MNTTLSQLPDFGRIDALNLETDSHAVGLGEEASVVLDDFEHERCVSEFLKLHTPRVIPPRSKILLLAGEVTGDAVWLSAQGHEVTVGMSDSAALGRARRFAQEAGFGVEFLEIDLERAHFGLQKWDIVVLYHLHLPMESRSLVHQRAARALCRGGVLLLEESWLHIDLQEEELQIVAHDDFFGEFMSEVEDSESYTRAGILADFSTSLHNLSIQEYRQHASPSRQGEFIQNISLVGFF